MKRTRANSSALKVVFLFIGMPVGGAEDFALGVYPHLAPEVSARFVCLRSLDVLGEEAHVKGLPVELHPFFPGKRIGFLNIWRFARWLSREGIDVLHTQTYHAHLFGSAAALLARIPVVVHQQKTLGRMSWRKEFLFGWCLKKSKKIISLSEQTRVDIASRYSISVQKISVVPNAIDEQEFRPSVDRAALRRSLNLPENAFLFGTVASLHAVKNHRSILEALSLANKDAYVVFVGDGVERPKLERLARESGIDERVFFVGRQRPAAPWFQAFDAFLLASSWEGQALALLQAISCGLPVLVSRIEGNTAVVGMKHAGLFDPFDTAALAELMNSAFLDPARYLSTTAKVPTCREAAAMLKKIYTEVE